MAEANAIFTLNRDDLTIQCKTDDKMKDICEKYSSKINKEMNSLMFLYEGKPVNFELKFREQVNHFDSNTNKMRIQVDINENEKFICPKCKQKIELNTKILDELIIFSNEIIESISGIKFQIDNIANISTTDSVKTQLKNINKMLNIINGDIKNNNEKIKNLLKGNNCNNTNNNNIINININKNNINNKKKLKLV